MATNKEALEKKLFYPELSYVLVGILFSIHNELGQYAREKQYADLLDTKLKEVKIPFKRELAIGDSGNILDFLVDNKIIVELKAIRTVTGECYRQVQNYLQQTGIELGLLVNFRNKYLKPLRIVRIH